MAVTVVVTVGGASSNSYATAAEIATYAESTVWESEWDGLTADEQAAMASRSARGLDRLSFRGRVADDVQVMQWPRVEAYRPSGSLWSSTAIPKPIKDAQAHIAAWLAFKTVSVDPFLTDPNYNVKRKKLVDVVGETEYFGSQPTEGERFLSEVIAPLLRPHLLVGAAGSVRLVR